MPNQNECDHWVGMTVRELPLFLSGYLRMGGMIPVRRKFNFCANCGAKINWKKIEEMANKEEQS